MKVISSLVCIVWLFAACGDVNVVNTLPDTASPGNLGGEGDDCGANSDCKSGLKCISGSCVDETKGGPGENCTKTADCQLGLKCLNSECSDPSGPDPGNNPCGQGECPAEIVGNGNCDAVCDCEQTGYDGDDCWMPCGSGYCSAMLQGDGQCNPECDCQEAGFDNGDCQGVIEGNCGPPAVEYANGDVWGVFDTMSACYCEAQDNVGAFVQCASPTGQGPSPECLVCFHEYLHDCVQVHCPECSTCASAGEAFDPGHPCGLCITNAQCDEPLYDCTGGVDWEF